VDFTAGATVTGEGATPGVVVALGSADSEGATGIVSEVGITTGVEAGVTVGAAAGVVVVADVAVGEAMDCTGVVKAALRVGA
jgi:hypothetical protein